GVVLPDGPYETVAGFLVAALTRLPVVGDTVVEGDNEFRVVELDGRRISRVSVTSVQPATPVAESAPDLED
ncbi:MAG: transporter associated domain-containing protein, partial [Actinomycetota bacterium]|nr:transporter associated domain-containing protein [Actinomycetota bacterium]